MKAKIIDLNGIGNCMAGSSQKELSRNLLGDAEVNHVK